MTEHTRQNAPLQFSPPPALPMLAPSVLTLQENSKQSSTTKFSKAWWLLWMLPVFHFAIGSLLSLNVAMADSVLPTMAVKDAESNVRIVRLVMEADVPHSSYGEAQPQQETWMAEHSQNPQDYEEADVAHYSPILESAEQDAILVQEMEKIAGQPKTNTPFLFRKKASQASHTTASENPFAQNKSARWSTALHRPLARLKPTSHFGHRWGRMHTGIDLAAKAGTPILAAEAGTVVFSGRQTGYGQLVVIEHDHGITTKYAHCSKRLVSEGQAVERGESIALVGQTGRTTDPHLHFEVLQDGEPQNPIAHL